MEQPWVIFLLCISAGLVVSFLLGIVNVLDRWLAAVIFGLSFLAGVVAAGLKMNCDHSNYVQTVENLSRCQQTLDILQASINPVEAEPTPSDDSEISPTTTNGADEP